MLFNNAESFSQAVIVFSYIASIILIQVLILFLISLLSETLYLFVLGFALSANALFLKLLFSKTIQSFSDVNLILLVTISGLVVGAVLNHLNNAKKSPGMRAIILTGFIFIVVPAIIAQYKFYEKKPAQEDVNKSEKALKAWAQVKFKERPNIHLISIDSLIPVPMLREYLDIKKPPYEDTLIAYTLRKDISYSPRIPSNPSINSVMQLDQTEALVDYGNFAGRKPSVLSTVFANNDYEISTGFFNHYFGKKGTYIDNYLPIKNAEFNNTLLCLDEGESFVKQMRFFSICSVSEAYSKKTDIDVFMTGTAFLAQAWPEKVLDVILQLNSKSRPQLSFHYIYVPIGHTRNHFRHNNVKHRSEYKDYYLEKGAIFDELLKQLLSIISISDPKSIVVIF